MTLKELEKQYPLAAVCTRHVPGCPSTVGDVYWFARKLPSCLLEVITTCELITTKLPQTAFEFHPRSHDHTTQAQVDEWHNILQGADHE